jgi:hypothetical protein
MHSSRANNSSNINWIKPEYFDFTAASGYINFAKHLFPLVESQWTVVDNAYSEIPQLEKRLGMFASGIQTRGANIANAAVLLSADTDISHLQELFVKARSSNQDNMLVMGNLSSPISLILDVSYYRFLYIHMSDYFN